MRVSVLMIIKIELSKFLKRGDLLAIAGMVAVAFICAIGMRQDIYTGVENQNALFWTSIQMVTTTALFIGPVVMAFLGTQMLSSEIDNKSILLFTVRIRDRFKIYIGKSIALMIISIIFYIFTLVMMVGIYFGIANNGGKYVSGTLTGNNVRELLSIIILIFMYTFFFIPQFTLMIGTKFKPLISIVMAFIVTLVCNHVATYSFIKYINPMNYVYHLSNHVLETTEALSISTMELITCVMMQMLLCLTYYAFFVFEGARIFEGEDL